MSTVCNSALPNYTTPSSKPIASSTTLPWAVGCWRSLILCGLFSVIFQPEFLRGGNGDIGSFVYGKAIAGFRAIDLGILALVLLHLIALACSRQPIVHFPRALLLPGAAFLGCIAIGVGYGYMRGGNNFFFDWRALALGMGLFFVWAFWIRTPADVRSVAALFGIYMAVRIAILFVLYAAGRGDTLLGIPIPTFDGPALSAIVFTALLAFRYRETCKSPHRLFWSALAVASCLIVSLCFRRTYWAEIAIGTALLQLLWRGHRKRNFLWLGATLCIVAIALGKPFVSRIQSFDVTQMDGEFSADNPDHMHDLQDAWDQVRQSPLMGIGVGTAYPTWRIRNWKNESVMVHNAPIHVWLKYGAVGLVCYLWFHIASLRWLYRGSGILAAKDTAFVEVAFAYLTAQFVVTLTFAPWPYSELQLTTLISFIVAAAFCGVRSSPRQMLARERLDA